MPSAHKLLPLPWSSPPPVCWRTLPWRSQAAWAACLCPALWSSPVETEPKLLNTATLKVWHLSLSHPPSHKVSLIKYMALHAASAKWMIPNDRQQIQLRKYKDMHGHLKLLATVYIHLITPHSSSFHTNAGLRFSARGQHGYNKPDF